MGPRSRVPKRGEIYSIDPNPVVGREMRDRHYWIVLTPEAVNVHGVAVAVVVTTAAFGARAAGLTVPVSGDGITGVAICTHLRSFDLRSRSRMVRRVSQESWTLLSSMKSRLVWQASSTPSRVPESAPPFTPAPPGAITLHPTSRE